MQRRATDTTADFAQHSYVIMMLPALLLALFMTATIPYTVHAQARACPVQVGEGVICSGPQVPEALGEQSLGYLPLIQASAPADNSTGNSTDDSARPCPYPVGEGVICRGPDVPPTQPPATDNSIDSLTDNATDGASNVALDAGPSPATPPLFIPFIAN